MAQWVSLGLISVTEEWQQFPVEAITSHTFRVIQQFSIYPLRYCQIAQFFYMPSDGGITAPIRRIYPSDRPYILTLPIPRELEIQGIVVRSIGIRRPLPAYDAPQTVELQVLY